LHGEKALQLLIKYTRVFVLTLYIVNKNYQWILTFGLQKYLLPSKLLVFFSFIHVCCKLTN
jgi:hypothetical protein